MQNVAIKRITAGCIAFTVFAVLLLRVYLTTVELGSITSALLHLSQFFTILTNLSIGVLMLLFAINKPLRPLIVDAFAVAIVGVGLIYHSLLSQLWSPEGLVWLADQGVHTLVPILSLMWWLKYSQVTEFVWRHIVVWIFWPLIYCSYALIRAQLSHFYPYPFLNLDDLGVVQLTINVIGLCVSFLILGLVIFGIRRLISNQIK